MATCLAEVPLYSYVSRPGYNAGVSLPTPIPGDGFVSFQPGEGTPHIVAGFTYADNTAGLADIAYGFRFSQGLLNVVEGGEARLTPGIPYDSRDAFMVIRVGDQIAYCVRPWELVGQDGIAWRIEDYYTIGTDLPGIYYSNRMPGIPLPGEPVYVSTLPSQGDLFFDSTFYFKGDTLCVLDLNAETWLSDEVIQQYLWNDDYRPDYATDEFIFTSGYLSLTLNGTGAGRADSEAAITSRAQWRLPLKLTSEIVHIPVAAQLDGQFPLPEIDILGSATASAVWTGGAELELPAFEYEIAGGLESDPDITTTLQGFLPLPEIDILSVKNPDDGGPVGGVLEGVENGKLYVDGFIVGWEGSNPETYVRGYFKPPTMQASTTFAVEQDIDASFEGLVPIDIVAYSGTFEFTGVAEGELPIVMAGAGTLASDPDLKAVAGLEIPFQATIIGEAEFDNYFQILLPEFDNSQLQTDLDITEEIIAATEMQVRMVNLVRDFIEIASTPRNFSQRSVEVTDLALAVARTLPDYALMVQETFNVNSSMLANSVVITAEQVLAAGVVQTFTQAIAAVLSAVAVSDATKDAYSTTAESALTIGDATAEKITRLALMTDAIQVSENLTSVLTIALEVSDTFVAGDSTELTATLLAQVLEYGYVYGLLKTALRGTDGLPLADGAETWVMNTEGANPLSEYDNYQFNSLTYYKDELYGTTDEGLYALSGANDAGTDITAELSSMMLDMGTSRLKRVRSAYLGYTSTDELVLKVRSVDDGQLTEHWYKAKPVSLADAPREGYVRIGQGLRSRYWQFELTNVNGGEFEIDQIELHPLVLSRRI